MTKTLIVNADDFGTDEARSRGILKACRDGIVTSTSVIANVPWHEEWTTELGSAFGERVGVHLNLTKGEPLTSGSRTLASASGSFFDRRSAWSRALLGLIDLDEVEGEFAAQIALLRDRGIVPDHIDGNNHIHVFPGIAKKVAGLARDFGIRRVRLPLEHSATPGWPRLGSSKRFMISSLARSARSHFRTAGLVYPDSFAGVRFPNTASLDELHFFVAHLPEGVTELMCHPGYSSPGNPFSSPARERELAALTHPSLRDAIARCDVRLVGFGELE